MTEEVKEKLFSEIGKDKEWIRPQTMLVLRKKGLSYPAYFNAKTNKFGPLLEATIYEDNEVPNVKDAEVLDYREVIGVK